MGTTVRLESRQRENRLGTGAGLAPSVSHDAHLEYLGIRSSPFPVVPDAENFFLPSRLDELIAELLHGIQTRKGFMLLTGEVGLGKTTISRRLLHTLEAQNVDTALIFNTLLEGSELLQAINEDFGVGRHESLQANLAALNQFLLERHHLGRNCAILIDDAQNLTDAALELIRMLSNLETQTQKLVQIVLIGQPELNARLSRPELRQIRSRVAVNLEVQALSADESRQYIYFRLNSAGVTGRIQITEAAFRLIHAVTQGSPRQINILMDRSLYGLCAYETTTIDDGLIREAVQELGLGPLPVEPQPTRGLARQIALALGLAALIVIGVVLAIRPAALLPQALLERLPFLDSHFLMGERVGTIAGPAVAPSPQEQLAAAAPAPATGQASAPGASATGQASAPGASATGQVSAPAASVTGAAPSESSIAATPGSDTATPTASSSAAGVRADATREAAAGQGTAREGTAREGTAREGTAREAAAGQGTAREGTAREGAATTIAAAATATPPVRAPAASIATATTAAPATTGAPPANAANPASAADRLAAFLEPLGLGAHTELLQRALNEGWARAAGERIAADSGLRLVILDDIPQYHWPTALPVHAVTGAEDVRFITFWQPDWWVRTYHSGHRSEAIAALQDALARLGHYGNATVDGIVGPATMRAVEAFQNRMGLPVTGTPDTATQFLLHQETATLR